jgi:PKHD-type hydroxylase
MGINLHYGAGQKWTLPQNWMVFKTGFDKNEIKKILKDIKDVPFVDGTTFGEKGVPVDTKQRKSKVKWLQQNEKFAWIYEKILGMCEDANNKLWNFNIHALPEMMQYTEYDAKDKGHYDWHQDIGPDIGSLRKISVTVQLSDNDEYEGGHLEYYSGGPMEGPFFRAHRGVGTTFCFPSYMLHRVTPVTKGMRKSLVLWIGGSSYK